MKKLVLALSLTFALSYTSFATVHVVADLGFTFTPDSITIMLGDTVDFQINQSHDAVEVSQSTWNANGTTPLQGGFNVPFGGGQAIITTPGVHYYVCVPHVVGGMKGRIFVVDPLNIEGNNNPLSFKMFPNPTQEFVWIEGNVVAGEGLSYSITDLKGSVLRTGSYVQQSGQASFMIPVYDLPSGTYFIRMRSGTLVTEKKLVKI